MRGDITWAKDEINVPIALSAFRDKEHNWVSKTEVVGQTAD